MKKINNDIYYIPSKWIVKDGLFTSEWIEVEGDKQLIKRPNKWFNKVGHKETEWFKRGEENSKIKKITTKEEIQRQDLLRLVTSRRCPLDCLGVIKEYLGGTSMLGDMIIDDYFLWLIALNGIEFK